MGEKGLFANVDFNALSSGEIKKPDSNADWLTVNGSKVETPFYSLEFAPDGSILSLKDKELCREWVKGDFNKLKIYHDTPGNYDAWDIDAYSLDKEYKLDSDADITPVYDGERAGFVITRKYQSSEINGNAIHWDKIKVNIL